MTNNSFLKARITLLIALILTFTMLGSALSETFGVIYNTDSLNLRSQGNSSSQLLGTYNRGSWVTINGSQNNFYYVKTADNRQGYMSKNYVDTSGSSLSATRVAIVNNKGGKFLNFRAQPNYSSQVYDIFYDGVPLYVMAESNGWYNVCINAKFGYVASQYVDIKNRVASSDVATIKTPNNGSMNLRTGPGTGYGVTASFSGDRYVSVLKKGTNWWMVSIDGYTGFMSSQFLQDGLCSAKDIAAGGGGGGTTGTAYAVVANPKSTQALNLRAYASTGAGVLGKLYNGTKLWIDAQGTEWCKVTVENTGVSGYVMTKYLSLHNLPATPQLKVTHPSGTFVNLRSVANINDSTVLVRVPSGKYVTVVSPGSDWTKVQYNGNTGYMLTYFLK
ncbi:MAG: SH3 domain-containing protein [Clostridiales bacterium]|nr:SH3 domain-containing protein [Clostridiales bacterium]